MSFPGRSSSSVAAGITTMLLSWAAYAHGGSAVRLSLEDALRVARAQAPLLRAARAEADAARASVTRTRALAWPTITLSGIVTPAQRAPEIVVPEGTIVVGGIPLPGISFEARTTAKYLATAELEYALWTWGRTGRAIDAARAGADAARARAARAQDDVERAVRRAFHAALLAEDLLRVAEQDSALHDQLVAVAQARVRAGDLARVDLVATRAERARSGADVTRARGGAQAARVALAFAIGSRDTTEVAPAGSLETLVRAVAAVPDPDALAREASGTRADVRAARALTDAARAAWAAARKANWPVLGLTARLLYQDDRVDHLLDVSGRVYTVGVGVSAPLFDGWRAGAATREAEATARAAEYVAVQSAQGARFETRAAAIALAAALAETKSRSEAVVLAEDRARIAETAFRSGEITSTDVTAAAVALAAARVSLADARARVLDADADLRHASGQVAR